MARTPIQNISVNDNFRKWFEQTQKVIDEISWINSTGITGITGGNAIGITTDTDRNYTVRFTGNVGGVVTFSGPVTFQDTVTANSLNVTSTRISFTPKVAGLTAGNVVRVASTGLTLAKANTAENAEILGIVVNEDASSNIIAIAGQVDNTLMNKTISNALGIDGGTLGKGSAYFLSPSIAGGITTIEPNTYGHVSKPILLGITGDSGMILPYRGVVIEGISAGITSELDNKIIIKIDYTALTGFTNGSNMGVAEGTPIPLKIGDPVFYFFSGDDLINGGSAVTPVNFFQNIRDDATENPVTKFKLAGVNSSADIGYYVVDWTNSDVTKDNQDGTDLNTYQYIGNKPFEVGRVLGLLSAIVATPTDLGEDAYILEITLPGGVIKNITVNSNTDLSDLDKTFYSDPDGNGITRSGSYYIQPIEDTSTYGNDKRLLHLDELKGAPYRELYTFLDLLKTSASTADIIFQYKTQKQFADPESAYQIIPAFSPSISGGSTGTSISKSYLPNGTFSIWQRNFLGFSGATGISLDSYINPICDRWFYNNTFNNSGLTLSIQKKEFDSNQTEVPGSPYYYVTLKNQYSGIGSTLEYRPKFENIQYNARLLQGQTATFCFYAKSTVSGSTLDLVFNRYHGEPLSDGYMESAFSARSIIVSGISLSGSWKKYSHTFVVPAMGSTLTSEQNGWISFGFEIPSSAATISLAQASLQSGYESIKSVYPDKEEELLECKKYYQRTYDLDETDGSTNSRGNETTILLGNLNGQIKYPVKFPIKMIETPNDINIYSSVTGIQTEAYNVNAGQDLRYTQGTLISYPWSATAQYRVGGNVSGNTTIHDKSKHGYNIQINYSGAASLDTIKFHWVADSDFKITV